MSVTNQTNKISGSGNGSTTAFSYPFKIFDTSELVVYLINVATGIVTGPLVNNVDYIATINPIVDGGTITFTVAPATGVTWFVSRIVPFTQGAVIPTEGVLPGKQIENQLDLLTMMNIQMNEAITRCAQVPVTSTAVVILPEPAIGQILQWGDSLGTLVNVPIPTPSTVQGLVIGTPGQDGAWQFILVGTKLSIQRLESGVWVEKGSFQP